MLVPFTTQNFFLTQIMDLRNKAFMLILFSGFTSFERGFFEMTETISCLKIGYDKMKYFQSDSCEKCCSLVRANSDAVYLQKMLPQCLSIN